MQGKYSNCPQNEQGAMDMVLRLCYIMLTQHQETVQ